MKKYIHFKLNDINYQYILKITNIIKSKNYNHIDGYILYKNFNDDKKWRINDVKAKCSFYLKDIKKIKYYNNIKKILIDIPELMVI